MENRKVIKQFISIMLSIILVIVSVPENAYAADDLVIYFDILLNDDNDVRILGDFYAENTDTGMTYDFVQTGTIGQNNSSRFQVYVPAGVYELKARNENVQYSFDLDMNDHPNGVLTSARFFSVDIMDGTDVIDTRYIRYGHYFQRPSEVPEKHGYVFDKWMDENDAEAEFPKEIVSHYAIYATWTEAPRYNADINIQIDEDNQIETAESLIEKLGSFTLWEINSNVNSYGMTPEDGMSYGASVPPGEYGVLWNGERLESHMDTLVITDADNSIDIEFNSVHYMDGEDELFVLYGENGAKVPSSATIPSKDGHSFEGWVTEDEGDVPFDFDSLLTEETYIFADFEELHVHDYEDEWTYDDDVHYHQCVGCDAYTDEAEHEFGDGEWVVIPTENVEGVMLWECIECGYELWSDVSYMPDDGPDDDELEDEEPEDTDEGIEGEPEEDYDPVQTPGDGEEDYDDEQTLGDGEEDGVPNIDDDIASDITADGYDNIEDGTDIKDDGNNDKNHKVPENSAPYTADSSGVQIYATLAMISGFLYLLTYFKEYFGMTEEEKKDVISKLINWARGKNRLARWMAMAMIFAILCYYHAIGKKIQIEEELDLEF